MIKILRTDNGSEFCNHEFTNYCKQVGIARNMTCSETPQQNGIAKRMNRTILKKVRCLLKDSKLLKKFWAEAVSTACYQINRCPSSTINFKTPEHMWTEKLPILDHMKPFGCIGYVHKKEGKLDPRAHKAVFL